MASIGNKEELHFYGRKHFPESQHYCSDCSTHDRVQIAQDKAYTAISWGMATHEWYDFVKDDPPLLHGIIKTDRLIVFGGGYPMKTDAGIIGGIGVSGGHYTHDMEVAQAGLAAL